MTDDASEHLKTRRSVRLFAWFLLAMSVVAQRIAGSDEVGLFFSNDLSPALWGAGIVIQFGVIVYWLRQPSIEVV